MDDLITEVWILYGLTGSEPALLSYENGAVRLQVVDDDNNLVEKFLVDPTAISAVKYPKVQMSGGCSITVEGQKYRLSFLRPQNTRLPGAIGAIEGVASISGGRKAGKAWKPIFGVS